MADTTKKTTQDQAPVGKTPVHGPNEESLIDTIIKVIIDILAKIFGQPSPTWGKNPTASASKVQIQDQVTAGKEKVWNTVTGGLGYLGNTMENIANSAVQKAGTTVKQTQEKMSNVATQATNMAKEQAQNAVNTAQNSVNQTREQVQKSASDMIDGAKKTAESARDSVKKPQ